MSGVVCAASALMVGLTLIATIVVVRALLVDEPPAKPARRSSGRGDDVVRDLVAEAERGAVGAPDVDDGGGSGALSTAEDDHRRHRHGHHGDPTPSHHDVPAPHHHDLPATHGHQHEASPLDSGSHHGGHDSSWSSGSDSSGTSSSDSGGGHHHH